MAAQPRPEYELGIPRDDVRGVELEVPDVADELENPVPLRRRGSHDPLCRDREPARIARRDPDWKRGSSDGHSPRVAVIPFLEKAGSRGTHDRLHPRPGGHLRGPVRRRAAHLPAEDRALTLGNGADGFGSYPESYVCSSATVLLTARKTRSNTASGVIDLTRTS